MGWLVGWLCMYVCVFLPPGRSSTDRLTDQPPLLVGIGWPQSLNRSRHDADSPGVNRWCFWLLYLLYVLTTDRWLPRLSVFSLDDIGIGNFNGSTALRDEWGSDWTYASNADRYKVSVGRSVRRGVCVSTVWAFVDVEDIFFMSVRLRRRTAGDAMFVSE